MRVSSLIVLRTIFEMRQDRKSAFENFNTPGDTLCRCRAGLDLGRLRTPRVSQAQLNLRTPAETSIGAEAGPCVDRQKVAIFTVSNQFRMLEDAASCSDFASTTP
jgi:hypothetical protein